MNKHLLCIVASILFLGVSLGFLPEDMEPVGTELTGPGRRTFVVEVEDVNGNYEGNFLKIKLLGTPEVIVGLQLGGVHRWMSDPNYFVIENAIPDANDPNTTLSGSFTIARVWKPGIHEIGFWVFDSVNNSDCKWGYIDTKDRKPPEVKKFKKPTT